MDEVLKDERFSHIFTDPRFRKMPRNVRKIKVDKRFQDMFNDSRFKSKCKIDKRGRQINLTSSEDLKKLYNITSESSNEEDEEPSLSKPKKHPKNKKNSTSLIITEEGENAHEPKKSLEHQKLSCEDSSGDDNATKIKLSKKLKNKKGEKLKDVSMSSSTKKESNTKIEKSENEKLKIVPKSIDTNRNISKLDIDVDDSNSQLFEENSHQSSFELQENIEDNSTSESSEDSSDAESESDGFVANDNFDHNWEELNKDAPDTNQVTRRLALCNMDWDRIRAVDLMAVFNSFKTSEGSIYSAKIYPSEYGLQRMEEERLRGPPELVEKVLGPDEEENEDRKGQRYNREKLRQYQINRLKYYFAVIETDSPETANSLYEQLNGIEYESCSVRFDLRFIPDDITFDQEPVSVAEEVPTEYKPRLFVTTALQQVKVNLTWDETDPKRQEIFQKAFTDPESIESDIKAYLASSSEESEVENEDNEINNKLSSKDRISKYKALLQSLEEEEKNEEEKYDKEITYQSGLKEETEEIVKEKVNKDNLNPFEEMMKKKKEKMKLKKKEKKSKNEVLDESSDEDDVSLSGEVINESGVKDNKALAELALMSDTKKLDSFGKKQKKRNKNKIKTENLDEFQCNVSDPRFSAIYSSHLYNIDPSDPHFKKTPGNMAMLQEKQKKFKHDRTDFDSKKAKKAKYKL